MIIKNVKIVKNNEIIDNGYIEIQDKLIVNIGKGNYEGSDLNVIDGNKKIAMPGFIDLHTHGGYGVDFMEADEEQINHFAKKIYEEGVTTFLLTTLTSDMDSLKKVCNAVANSIKSSPALYGIHLEGPYISLAYKGAQNEAYIRDCNIDEINDYEEVSGIFEEYSKKFTNGRVNFFCYYMDSNAINECKKLEETDYWENFYVNSKKSEWGNSIEYVYRFKESKFYLSRVSNNEDVKCYKFDGTLITESEE